MSQRAGESKRSETRKVVFLRSAEYNVTQAIPRFIDVMKRIVPITDIGVVCWSHGVDPTINMEADIIDGLQIHRFFGEISSRDPRSYVSALGFWAFIWKHAFRARILHASDVVSLIPSAAICELTGATLVADIRDPVGALHGSYNRVVVGVLDVLEQVCQRVADLVIVVDENRLDYVPRARRDAGAVVVIRNLPERDYLDELPSVELRYDKIRLNYSGYLSDYRGTNMLMEAGRRSADLHVDIVGVAEEAIQASMPANVEFHGRVSHARALTLMRESHLISLLYDPVLEANRIAAPNKLYEALMLGRPYITCYGTPMARYVHERDCGYCIEYGDVDALLAVIDGILSDPEDWQRKCGNARKYYEKSCQWKHETRKLQDAYAKILGLQEG